MLARSNRNSSGFERDFKEAKQERERERGKGEEEDRPSGIFRTDPSAWHSTQHPSLARNVTRVLERRHSEFTDIRYDTFVGPEYGKQIVLARQLVGNIALAGKSPSRCSLRPYSFSQTLWRPISCCRRHRLIKNASRLALRWEQFHVITELSIFSFCSLLFRSIYPAGVTR